MRPLLLEDGNKYQIEFVEKGSLGSETLFGTRTLDDEAHHKIANTLIDQYQQEQIGLTQSAYPGIGLVAKPSILS